MNTNDSSFSGSASNLMPSVLSGLHNSNIMVSLEDFHGRIRSLEAENNTLRSKIHSLTSQTKQLDEKVFDLFTISQAGKVFTATPDTSRLAEILLSMISERLHLDKIALMIFNSKLKGYEVVHTIGLPEDVYKVTYIPREGLFWQLIGNGEPFPVVDIEGNLRFSSVFRGSDLSRLESVQWIPMKTKDRIIGIITLGAGDVSHHDLDFLVQLVSQAAVSFETAFLYQEIGESRKELDRQMHNLSILYEIGKALNFIENLNKLLAQILDQAIEVVDASKGSLMLLDENSNELVVRVVRGIDKETEEKILSGEKKCKTLKKGEGIAGIVAETGQPILVEDAATDSRFLAAQMSNVNNLLCVPLRNKGEVIGVINMSNKKGGKTFNEEDERIIMTLADQAAVAISNANNYQMATTDGMTELYIRRHFMQQLDKELRLSKRHGRILSLLMTDIDHFKKLNDTYGHQAGDKVLIEVARIVRKSIRETDMAARYGGEEFCLMLPETGVSGAITLAQRIREAVENAVFSFMGTDIRCTISIGSATFPVDADSSEELIRQADTALYSSKHEGRNRVSSFSPPPEEATPSSRRKPDDATTQEMEVPEVHTLEEQTVIERLHHDIEPDEEAHASYDSISEVKEYKKLKARRKTRKAAGVGHDNDD